ncbi:MAG: protein phosphatase 2C domain-containing protein [Bacteroidales bacterium]
MFVHQLIKRGENHKDFCQDFVLAYELSERYAVYGVFDGCSSGIDSHFASTLTAKVFKAEFEYLEPENYETTREALNRAIMHAIESLSGIRDNLLLETDELLSTAILLFIDKIDQSGDIIVIGDGMVAINGKIHRIEQENVPDYLAYYLDQINTFEDFEKWLQEHAIHFHIDKIDDIVISTDGIYSFQKVNSETAENNAPEPADFMFLNEMLIGNPSMLSRKCNILKNKFGLVNFDDLGIIRIWNRNHTENGKNSIKNAQG